MGEGQDHDALFRLAMQDPEVAEALLRERLPPEVVEALAPGPPELLPGTFVDPALKGSASDALFRLRTRDAGEVWVYCLVEHKSAPDPWVPLQLLRYLVAIWERQRADGARTVRRGCGPSFPWCCTTATGPGTRPAAFAVC